MSGEVKGLEGKSIIVHEDVMPRQVDGELVYPRAYFEDDVKALIRKVKDEARRETLKEVSHIVGELIASLTKSNLATLKKSKEHKIRYPESKKYSERSYAIHQLEIIKEQLEELKP